MDSLHEVAAALNTHRNLTWNLSWPIIFASDRRRRQATPNHSQGQYSRMETSALHKCKRNENTSNESELPAHRLLRRGRREGGPSEGNAFVQDGRRRSMRLQKSRHDSVLSKQSDSRRARSHTSLDTVRPIMSPICSTLNLSRTSVLRSPSTQSIGRAALGGPDVDSANFADPGFDVQPTESLDGSLASESISLQSEAEEVIEDEVDEKEELEYQIPETALRAALRASPSSPAAYFSHILYRNEDGGKVLVQYCRSFQISDKVARDFLAEDVVGFDIEWKPNAGATSGIKENVSLIQIASPSRVALFHLAKFSGQTPETLMPPALRQIIESDKIIKTGVAILGDFTRIKTHLGVEGRGLVELSHLHNLVCSNPKAKSVGKKMVSLARQVEMHLQLPMWKGAVRVSNWANELSHEQCGYAAADAYASLRLFDVLDRKRLKLKPTPPRPEFAELKLPIVCYGAEDSSDESVAEELQESAETGALNTVSDVSVVYPDLSEQCLTLDLSKERSPTAKLVTAEDCEEAMLLAITELATVDQRLPHLSKSTHAHEDDHPIW